MRANISLYVIYYTDDLCYPNIIDQACVIVYIMSCECISLLNKLSTEENNALVR